MGNEDSFSYSPEAVPPVPSPPITVNQSIHDLENKINEEIQKGDPISDFIAHHQITNNPTPLKNSPEYRLTLKDVCSVADLDLTRRQRKQMARAYARSQKPLSILEQKILNDNSDIQVTDSTYTVDSIYDFKVSKKEPMVRIKWADTTQHLAFTKLNLKKTEQDFIKKGNAGNFEKLMNFIDKNPEYKDVLIPDEEFNKPEDDNEEEPEAAPKNTGGKRPQKQLPKKKTLVGPPNPPKSK